MLLISPICTNWNLVRSSLPDHDLLAALEPRRISAIELHRISRHQAGPKKLSGRGWKCSRPQARLP